jgi:DNA-binding SARP family transcriptional activator
MPRPRAHSVARDALSLPDVADDAELGALPLVFQTLGAARLVIGIDRVLPSTGTLFALLVRLAYSPEYRIPRDVLGTSLWPEQSVARQRGNLRQMLYKARAMGVNVSLMGDSVCLDPQQIVPTFSLSQTAALFEQDVVRGKEPFGVFLPSVATPWRAMQEWIEGQRATVHAGVRRVLVEQLRTRRERADWSGAEALARWLLQFDPLHEEATLTVAECTMLAGSKAEAVAILDQYLAEIGPSAGDIRLPATLLRKRFTEPATRRRPSFAPPERHFVGRTSELAHLTMAMRRARWHDGSAVVIEGIAGIGKTRLTNELCKVAVIEGVRILQASCRSTESTRNLGVTLDLVPEMLEEKGALGCSPESLRVLRMIRSEAPPEAEEQLDANSDPAQAPDISTRQPLPISSSIRAAFIELLLAISYERPTLLVIEDVQWLDEGSWELLVDLNERLEKARVFCVLTSRSLDPSIRTRSFLPSRFERLPLAPLEHEQSVQLARALASDASAELSIHLANWFAVSSDGGPLYLHALVNHWIETGEAGGVPPTLVSVLDQRLSQLSGDALLVLQTIALLEKLASPKLIKEILELETFRLLDSIEELARAHAMRENQTSIEVHHLLAKSALLRLSHSSLLVLRRRIGDVLASKLEYLSAPIELVVCENIALAGDVDELARFVLDASRLFLRKGEAHRAVDLYDASIPYLQDHDSRSAIHSLLQDALYLGGYYGRLLDCPNYLERIANSDSIWDTSHPTEVLRMLEAADHSSNSNDYQDLASRALLITESPIVATDVRIKAAAVTIRSAGNSSIGWHAGRAYKTAIDLLSKHMSEPFQSDLIDMYYHTLFDDLDRGSIAARRVAIYADGLIEQNTRIKLLSDAAWALRVTGAVREARMRFEEVARDARGLRMFTRSAVSSTFRSSLAFESDNDIESAYYWLEFCGELVTACNDSFVAYTYHCQRARIAILTDDIASARSSVTLLRASSSGHAFGGSYLTALRLGLARMEEDVELMKLLMPQLLHSFREEKSQVGRDFRSCQLVKALKALDQVQTAESLLVEYVRERRRERTPIPVYLSEHIPE